MRFRSFFVVLLLTTFSAAAQAQVVTLNKGGYTLTYDCTNRTALRYEYVLQADTGSAARPSQLQSGYRIAQRLCRADLHGLVCQRAFRL